MMTDFSIPDDDNPVCMACGLFKDCRHPFMEPSGPDDASIMIIGEAPGAEEDKAGEPFVGPSGQHLRTALEGLGVDLDDIVMTNIVRCRPPNNKVLKKHIEACKRFAIADIEEFDPPMVMLMGGVPLQAILGETGITAWNGVVVEKDDRIYLPLFHPSYILRNSAATDDWLEAMVKGIEGETFDTTNYVRTHPLSINQLKYMQEYLAGFEFISYDLETSTLDPYLEDAYCKRTDEHYSAAIIAASFCAGDRSFSFPIHHPDTWWTKSELELVEEIVIDIIDHHDGGILSHNSKFDQWYSQVQLGVVYDIGGDTMLLSHLIDSRPGIHGLKRVAAIYLGMYEYEAELEEYKRQHPEADPNKGGSYRYIPLDILLPYAAMDVEAVNDLHPVLYDNLSDKQRILYDEVIIKASDTICDMQDHGFPIDDYIAHRYKAIYEMLRQEHYNEHILVDPKVRRIIKRRQKKLDDEIEGTRRKRKIFNFNPNSPYHLRDLYFDQYKIPVMAKTKTGRPSTKADAYRHLEDKFPILWAIRYYNLLGHMVSTYLGPASNGGWYGGDGRARTNFNLHTVVTGRTSSSDPFNAQNLPTPEKEPGTLLETLPIKNLITHSYVLPFKDCVTALNDKWIFVNFLLMYGAGVVMSVDYSNMELRCVSSMADCKAMLQMFADDLDVHKAVASMISGIPYDEIDKPTRYIYKWTNWTCVYGGNEYTLQRLYGIPLVEGKSAMRKYFKQFPEIRDYQKWAIEFAEENGYIESPYGRKEYLPWIYEKRDKSRRNEARREAINMPVQSSASDTLLLALIITNYKLWDAGLKSRLFNEVHDSMMLDVPKDEVIEVAHICKDVMENITTYAGQYMPNLDTSWLKCKLKADVEVGSHYGSETSVQEWFKVFHGQDVVL